MNRRLARWSFGIAPFVLVGLGGRLLVPRLGDAMTRTLLVAASGAALGMAGPGDAEPAASAAVPVVSQAGAAARDPVDHPSLPGPLARAAAAPRRREVKVDHVVIAADRLLSLPAERLRAVRWTGVLDSRGHPAGVRLLGVGALGVGLVDGDVVMSIDGRPTVTEDDATAAGAAAWISGAREVHATILRKDRIIAVSVQLPPRAR